MHLCHLRGVRDRATSSVLVASWLKQSEAFQPRQGNMMTRHTKANSRHGIRSFKKRHHAWLLHCALLRSTKLFHERPSPEELQNEYSQEMRGWEARGQAGSTRLGTVDLLKFLNCILEV